MSLDAGFELSSSSLAHAGRTQTVQWARNPTKSAFRCFETIRTGQTGEVHCVSFRRIAEHRSTFASGLAFRDARGMKRKRNPSVGGHFSRCAD